MINEGNTLKEKSISKYQCFYYWKNLIQNEESLWENSFLNKPLTEDAIFIYTVLMDYKKGFLKSRWVYYPDVYALLGFLQYIFLPTSFFTWLDDVEEGFNIPLVSGDELLQIMCELEDTIDLQHVSWMKKQLQEISSYWYLSEEDCIEKIGCFSDVFNQRLRGKSDKLVYFKIFQNPTEIGEYVLLGGGVEEEVFIEVIEEEMEMTQDEWKAIYENAYKDPFIRKRFMDVLNDKIQYFI